MVLTNWKQRQLNSSEVHNYSIFITRYAGEFWFRASNDILNIAISVVINNLNPEKKLNNILLQVRIALDDTEEKHILNLTILRTPF